MRLGIEIGGTKLQLGLGRGDGSITSLRRLAIDPKAGAGGILGQIASAFGEFPAESIDAIGIGFGGPVDADRGVVLKSHQVSGWDGFPLADWVRSTLGVDRVAIQNDADTAALGEARFGAGAGMSPVLYVTIGSGIGGGLIVDGKIYRGAGHGAVEIGHLWYCDDHTDDHSASILEDVASGWAIGRAGGNAIRNWREVQDPSRLVALSAGDPDRVTAAMVAEAAALDDMHACLILNRAVRALGTCLAHAATLLAPRRIILGGGVSLIREDLWLDPVTAELNARVFPPFRGTFDVVTASLGEAVVVHGALAIAADEVAGHRGS